MKPRFNRMLIIICIILALIIAVLAYIYVAVPAPSARMPQLMGNSTSTAGAATSSESDRYSLRVGSADLKVGIADTEAERERGLSGRISLGDDEGLFFVTDKPSSIGIWMKNMNFSIDVIWLDSAMKVVDVVPDMQPSSYPQIFYPKSSAQYVLEVNAGTAARDEIKIGDIAELSKNQ